MLTAETRRKYAKFGHSSKNSSRSFHRFPNPSGKNAFRARKWVVWAYPNENWDDQALVALHKKERVICSAHFKGDSFTDHAARHLHPYAVPEEFLQLLMGSSHIRIHPLFALNSQFSHPTVLQTVVFHQLQRTVLKRFLLLP